MAKRTAALVVALVTLWASPAAAVEAPLWPCEVTVSIEPGPFQRAAEGAVRQLDEATVISWPVVAWGGPAMVTIEAGATETGGYAWSAATDEGMVAGGVVLDESTPARWRTLGFLHELGHIAGLPHNDEERSVMNASDVPWRKYQPVDLDALGDVTCRG